MMLKVEKVMSVTHDKIGTGLEAGDEVTVICRARAGTQPTFYVGVEYGNIGDSFTKTTTDVSDDSAGLFKSTDVGEDGDDTFSTSIILTAAVADKAHTETFICKVRSIQN